MFIESLINLVFAHVRLDVYLLLPASFHTCEREQAEEAVERRAEREEEIYGGESKNEPKPELNKVKWRLTEVAI